MALSVTVNEAFRNTLQSGSFRKCCFPVVLWTGQNLAFRKRRRQSVDLPTIRAYAVVTGDNARAVCLSVSFYRRLSVEFRYRISNFIISYRISNITAFEFELIFCRKPLAKTCKNEFSLRSPS